MSKRKYPAISVHQTWQARLTVNWERDYKGEFDCPRCNTGKLVRFIYRKTAICKLMLGCSSCGREISLTCRVPIKIYNYRPNVICPNPLCTGIGSNGQKGWVYQESHYWKCDFCGIFFDCESNTPSSWVGSQKEEKLLPFCFDSDTWDLRHLCDNTSRKFINFQPIQPQWYQLQVKRYLYELLKIRGGSFREGTIYLLEQFGRVLRQHRVQQPVDITRQVILAFIDACQTNNSHTLYIKLLNLKKFLEWLGTEASSLIRQRDFPKQTKNPVNWLDEVTRTAIRQHLAKIPAPIACHYLVQEYTAARPRDVCLINFDCLIEENGKWYVKFYQHKVARWHKLPATREIRRVIEEQQHWIRQTFGPDYTYLFCHFRVIRQNAYPAFANIKPLPIPPKISSIVNPMVRIIRLLIEQENISDTNGQPPHFIGKITRPSRLQEVRVKHGMEAAQLYADHKSSATTFQHYAPPTTEQIANVDLPFQELLMNPACRFLPWQSLPESLLKNPSSHELDLDISPRLAVYGHCVLEPKTPCPFNLYPKCYGCDSFRPSTGKLPLYERQYVGEQQRLTEAATSGAELAYEEAKATVAAMDKWLPELLRLADA